MYAIARQQNRPVSRISMSLPYALLKELDRMVGERGFISRSQAIADMLHQCLIEHKRERGDDVMVGTVTLVYDNSVPGLQKQLADLVPSKRDTAAFWIAGKTWTLEVAPIVLEFLPKKASTGQNIDWDARIVWKKIRSK